MAISFADTIRYVQCYVVSFNNVMHARSIWYGMQYAVTAMSGASRPFKDRTGMRRPSVCYMSVNHLAQTGLSGGQMHGNAPDID